MTSGSIQTARVTSNERVCREHFRLRVAVPAFAPASPGQFVHLSPLRSESNGYRTFEWSSRSDHRSCAESAHAPLLRRAFSIAALRRDAGVVEIEVIYRVVGKGTHWMASLSPGVNISLLGPLGNAFSIVADKSNAWMVAGGVGLPPMIWLATALAEASKTRIALCGAQSADLLALTLRPEMPPATGATQATLSAEEFAASGTPVVISTDDGSLGFHGHVGAALASFQQASSVDAEDLVVYTCGPERMMAFVAAFCQERRIECQVCMERAMACGTGMCQSCVVPVRDEGADGWHYSLCCTEGPVFRADTVLWRQPQACP